MDEITLIGQVGSVTVELKPLKDVAENHGYSRHYIKRLCQEGQLIAYKFSNRWFVEKNLSRIGSLTTLQDAG